MTERFVGLAQATHERARMPGAPMVVLPPSEETEYSEPARVAAIVDEALVRFAGTMVVPMPPPEKLRAKA
ncbi:MAG: hypothetical protein HYY95_06925 [Candidatus Rokubacteria bacterium]|nr:hypothetical protein [Candidatus Rokubacteria bacterium]MBI3105293.1 hypothetical protein [Candidatus Rokubacteria bacterium]